MESVVLGVRRMGKFVGADNVVWTGHDSVDMEEPESLAVRMCVPLQRRSHR